MIPLTSPIVMLYEYHLCTFVASGNRLRCSLQHFFAVVWFAAKIYRIGILMYGKTNMERAVQMVAILVEIKFGSEWFDFCHKVPVLPLSRTPNSRGARGYRLYQG
jgi:hypothetical protein